MPVKKKSATPIPPAERDPSEVGEATPAERKAQAAKKAVIAAPARTGETVTIGLKLPCGLQLALQHKVEVDIPVMMGGVKTVTEWRPLPDSKTFTLYGNAWPVGDQIPCLIVGGFAMTPGIPKDFWEQWLSQNAQLDIVKAGLIFASPSADHAKGQARENRDMRSGLEPLNVKGDIRAPRKRDRSGRVTNEDGIEAASKE